MRGKRVRSVLLVLVGVLVLGGSAACSSDDDDGGGGSAVEDSAPTGADGGEVGESVGGALDEPLAAYADASSEVYADPASWLCRPDVADDACDQDLDLTVVQADGTTTVESPTLVDDAPVDCFYVYPTISQDESVNSDLQASPDEEGFAALNQVARLGERCRVFAPVYRQTTLTGLSAALGGGEPPAAEAGEIAYGDVLEAWEHYLAEDTAAGA